MVLRIKEWERNIHWELFCAKLLNYDQRLYNPRLMIKMKPPSHLYTEIPLLFVFVFGDW